MQHRRVEPERRGRVDDREDRRLAVERRLVDPADDPGHLERVEVPLAAEAVGVERLVRQRHHVVDRVQMANRRVDVDRLDGIAREEVDRVEHLEEADEVLVVGAVADPPAAIEIRDVRGAADGPERGPVAAHDQVVGRVRGVEGEGRRRGLDPLLDHRGVETDPLRTDLGARAGRLQQIAGALVEEIHSDLLENTQRRDVDRLELVDRQDLGRPIRDPRLLPRPLWWQRAPLMTRPPAGSAARCDFPGRGFRSAAQPRAELLVVRHAGILAGRAYRTGFWSEVSDSFVGRDNRADCAMNRRDSPDRPAKRVESARRARIDAPASPLTLPRAGSPPRPGRSRSPAGPGPGGSHRRLAGSAPRGTRRDAPGSSRAGRMGIR